MLNKLRPRWWFWVAITLAAVTLLVAFLRKLLPFPRTIVAQHKEPGETLVVLFGDSITEGLMSHSFVDLLAQRMGREGYRFMNAGIGGDTAYNLLNCVGPVVKSQPDVVVILVGTNDLQAYLRGGYLPAFMQCMKKLPQALTLDWYNSNVRQLVQAVQHDTPAQVALCSIPILGEDLELAPERSGSPV